MRLHHFSEILEYLKFKLKRVENSLQRVREIFKITPRREEMEMWHENPTVKPTAQAKDRDDRSRSN